VLGMKVVMRGFRKIGVVAALVGAMLVAVSDASSGQKLNEVDTLNKTVDQDLTAEAERLDRLIIAVVSKLSAERNTAAEDQIRNRIGKH